jgi:hypothetical protein
MPSLISAITYSSCHHGIVFLSVALTFKEGTGKHQQ